MPFPRNCPQCGIAFQAKEQRTRFCSFECSSAWRVGRPKRQPRSTSPMPHLLCRRCGADWDYDGPTNVTKCPYCGATKDARDRRQYTATRARAVRTKDSLREWCADATNRHKRGKKKRLLIKRRVFFNIAGSIYPRCVRCGCNDMRLLEVNHKDGGGRQEFKRKGQGFYLDVANGRRPTDDLEILCRPCNAIHYLESRFGPLPIRVIWSADDDGCRVGSNLWRPTVGGYTI